MDLNTLSEITPKDQNYSTKPNQIRIKHVTPIQMIKNSNNKTCITRTLMAKVYKVPVSQFMSLVQRLTGCSPSPLINECEPEYEFSLAPFMHQHVRAIKAYEEDMEQCLNFLRRLGDHSIDDYDLVVNLTNNVTEECLNCLSFCCLFPEDYRLDSDTLIQLWIAAGFIKNEPMEDIANAYIIALCRSGVVLTLSREDFCTGKVWYKLNISSSLAKQIIQLSKISFLQVESPDLIHVLSAKISDHCHVILHCLPANFDELGRFTQVKTLLLLKGHRSSVIDRVPYDFFMKFTHLEILDLSRTRLSELPSSIGNARSLRYLDLSETLINQLPETIDGAQSLKTLKLQNCPRLIKLPKCTRKLTKLRHLDLGSLCRLNSMPPGIEALTNLCTLSNFVVGEGNCCSVGELKGMSNLRGKLCLSRLEKIASVEEATDARLCYKKHLIKLELRWTDHGSEQEENIRDDNLEIIEHLRPHPNLQDLRIICYGGSALPSWISNPATPTRLTSITLFKCESLQSLPSLGQFRSLESLSLIELVEVRIIDIDKGARDLYLVSFPRLKKLVIKSMLKLEEWRGIEKQDLPCLTHLEIKNCPELATLCKLSNLESLEHLEINGCTSLQPLLEGDFPTSLKMLVVEDCPSISMRCSMDTRNWYKIEHSPSLLVYQRKGVKEE